MAATAVDDDRAERDLARSTYAWLLALTSTAGLWLVRHGLTASVPAGTDVEAHVARTDAALALFRHGRLDGWFTGFGSGYRLFAVYGPGLALSSGGLKVLSLGSLDTARSLAVLGALSMAATPPALAVLCRELGATRRAAVVAAALALSVGYGFGGGVAGLYRYGLVPQALAVPVQLLLAAGLVRTLRTGSMRAAASSALATALLIVLHPISLVVVLAMVPGLLLAVARPWSWSALARTAGAPLWGAAIVAWWLLPAWRDRALRGELSAWTTPGLHDRITEVASGKAMYPTFLAVAVALALAVQLGDATRSPAARRLLVAPLTALAYLVVGHLGVSRGWAPEELWVQLPNRGLTLAGLLLLLPLASVLAELVDRAAAPARTWTLTATVAAAAFLAPLALGTTLGPAQVAPAPSDALRHAAASLAADSRPRARHLLAEPSPFVALGTSEPTRWLAVAAGRDTAQLYFPEATGSEGAGRLPSRFLAGLDPDEAVGPLRRAGITHVVVTDPIPASQLDGQVGYRLVDRQPTLAVYAVEPAADAPPVEALLQPDESPPLAKSPALEASLERPGTGPAAAERLRWRVAAGRPIAAVAAVAYDPAWTLTIDGEEVPIHRSGEDLVGFRLPAGRHEVELRFTGSRNHLSGLAVGAAALTAALWFVRPRGRPRPGAQGADA